MNTYTRKDYMNNKCTHEQYYGQFVTDGTRSLVKRRIVIEKIKASTDPHFNDIPLAYWDALVTKAPGSGLFANAGDFYTLACGVCMLKEAARQIKAGLEQ